jgi:hypothetical protein
METRRVSVSGREPVRHSGMGVGSAGSSRIAERHHHELLNVNGEYTPIDGVGRADRPDPYILSTARSMRSSP